MEKQKPYLTFSHPRPGKTAFLFKIAAQKSAERMRELTVEEHREAMERLADVRLIAPGTRVEPLECGGVPCEWVYRDDSPTDRVILYIHGGSWAFGSLRTARPVGMMLSAASGYRVLVVDYRLSPEHPFPAGVEDCQAVFQWLGENGYSADRVALFGDSAGGNLSLALIHHLKATGQPLPCAVGLASPATDLSADAGISKGELDQLYTQYEGRDRDLLDLYCRDNNRENPLISPVHGDLEGFPPMLIHVGQDEDMCIDCDRFAAKAHGAGVDVSLKIWKDMYHDFSIVGGTLKESRLSIQEFGVFFKKHLGNKLAEISLRDTVPGDLASIIECESGNREHVGQWRRAEHLDAIVSPHCWHLVAERDGVFLGFAILKGIGSANKNIELMRVAVNEPGHGYGREILRQILQRCFEQYGAHRLWLDVRKSNLRAQRVYEALGFVKEGLLRECVVVDGEYESLYIMSMLAREYNSMEP